MLESIKKLREQTGAGMMDVKKALADANGDEAQAVALLRERGIVKAAKKADREAKEGLIVVALSDDKTKGALVEVNSETDFVARNTDFQAMALAFAQQALSIGTGDLDTLKASVLPSGETVADKLAATAGKIGENLVLNRVAYLANGGIVAGYVHSNGKIGTLVEITGADAEVFNTAKDIALHVAAERPRYLNRTEVDADALEKEREILTNKAINEGKPEQIIEKIVSGQLSKFYEENVLLEQKFVKDNSVTVQSLLGSQTLNAFVRLEIGV